MLGCIPEAEFTRSIYRRIYSHVYLEKDILLKENILSCIPGEEHTLSCTCIGIILGCEPGEEYF